MIGICEKLQGNTYNVEAYIAGNIDNLKLRYIYFTGKCLHKKYFIEYLERIWGGMLRFITQRWEEFMCLTGKCLDKKIS